MSVCSSSDVKNYTISRVSFGPVVMTSGSVVAALCWTKMFV